MDVLRSEPMPGSATITIVTSTSNMNTPRLTAVSGNHFRTRALHWSRYVEQNSGRMK